MSLPDDLTPGMLIRFNCNVVFQQHRAIPSWDVPWRQRHTNGQVGSAHPSTLISHQPCTERRQFVGMAKNRNSKKPKRPFFLPKLRRSIYVLWTGAKLRRLFREEKGVEGVGWYATNRDDSWHVVLNVLRFFILIIFAPVYAILRLSPVSRVIAFHTPSRRRTRLHSGCHVIQIPG